MVISRDVIFLVACTVRYAFRSVFLFHWIAMSLGSTRHGRHVPYGRGHAWREKIWRRGRKDDQVYRLFSYNGPHLVWQQSQRRVKLIDSLLLYEFQIMQSRVNHLMNYTFLEKLRVLRSVIGVARKNSVWTCYCSSFSIRGGVALECKRALLLDEVGIY